MVDRVLVSQLQSLNASQRREAIIALGRTKDRDAIPHLSRVAENDPDDDLRELARKAAIYIDKNAPVVNVKPFKMPWDDDEAEEEAEPEPMAAAASAVLSDYAPPTPEEIAAKEAREWADRFVEKAWEAHYTGNRDGAETYLRKAFERFPGLAEVETARDAASKIMNMNPDRAVNALLKPKTLRRPGSGKPDTKSNRPGTRTTGSIKIIPEAPKARVRTEKTIDEIEDGTAKTLFTDLFIFFFVVFAVNFITLFALSLVVDLSMDAVVTSEGDAAAFYSRGLVMNAIASGTSGIILYAALGAIATVLQTLFLWFIIHIVASTLLGGNSTFARLVRKTYPFFALSQPVLMILALLSLYIAMALNDAAVIISIFAVAGLLSIFLLAWRIGVAYRFDIGRGCVTMIMTWVALACCGVTVGLALVASGVGPFAAIADQLATR